MSQELTAAAKGLIESLDRIREFFPDYHDSHLVRIARAIHAPSHSQNGAAKKTKKARVDEQAILRAMEQANKPALAKEIASTLNMSVGQVVTGLKKLHAEGKVKAVKKQVNGTALWVAS